MPDLEANGARFHVQQVGQGDETVVMLHGLLIDNLSSLYYSLAPGLADRMQVLLYDLRGHGQSERTPTGYTLGDAVDDLWAVVEAAGIEGPVHLLGNSYGGTIALEAARRTPERVRSLILIEAHFATEGFAEMIAQDLILFDNADQIDELRTWLEARGARRVNRLSAVVERLMTTTSFPQDLISMPVTTMDDLRSIAVPTYAVYGEYSDVIERARDLEAALPDLELDILDDCSHSIFIEATATARRLLAERMDRLRDGTTVAGRTRAIAVVEGEGSGAVHAGNTDRARALLAEHLGTVGGLSSVASVGADGSN